MHKRTLAAMADKLRHTRRVIRRARGRGGQDQAPKLNTLVQPERNLAPPETLMLRGLAI